MVLIDFKEGETRTEWPSNEAINSVPGYLSESCEPGYSFTSPYPCIEARNFTGGRRSVIRGTRISVANIIGYLLLGESPEDIAGSILPINLVQLVEAKQYYAEHKEEIDREIAENIDEISKNLKR